MKEETSSRKQGSPEDTSLQEGLLADQGNDLEESLARHSEEP